MNAAALTRDRFAQLVMARLRTRGASQIEYGQGTFSIGFRLGAGQGMLNLVNVHQSACRVAPPEVARLIDAFIDQHEAQQKDRAGGGYEAVAPKLMPVVRDVRYFGMSMLQVRNSGVEAKLIPQVPFRTLGGEVVLALFVDSERSMTQVDQAQLEGWGVGFEEALQRAMENLRQRSAPRFTRQSDGFYVSAWQDDYDPSRLLLPELLTALPIRGEPVVGIPSRNHLLVAGSRDGGALKRLVQATAKLIDSEPRPVSAQLLRYSGNRWGAFDEVVSTTPQLHEAAFKLLHRDYAQQKELLEAILRKDGTDLFVATWQALKTTEGPVSMAQWTRNVDSLLPKAERLALLDMETREMLVVPWAQAATLLGDALRPQGMYPERYLVSGYPDAQQLVKLRGMALTKARV